MSETVETTNENYTSTVSLTNNDTQTVTLDVKPKQKESQPDPPPKKPKKTTTPSKKPDKKKSKKAPKKDYSIKRGHIEGKDWIWGDGKKTPFKFLQQGVMQKKLLPPGFFRACETSSSPSLKKLAKIAKKRELKELK